MDGAAGIFVLIVGAIIYFLPGINAASRKHRSAGAVFLLNLLLGWTVLGWIVALVWSATGDAAPKKQPDIPGPGDPHRKCPDCAELVLKEAKVCKHCGCRLDAIPVLGLSQEEPLHR